MKLFFILFAILTSQILPAQSNNKIQTTIEVLGYSKLTIRPDAYVVNLIIQEEEKKVGYTTIGKTPIDSVKQELFTQVAKFGLKKGDIKFSGTSSRELSQFPDVLINQAYTVNTDNKELAEMLVEKLRFGGLKGVVVRGRYSQKLRDAINDTLNNTAVADARRIATELAKKHGKASGEILNIEVRTNSIASFGIEGDAITDYYNPYSYNRFEVDNRDKIATCIIKVVFELK